MQETLDRHLKDACAIRQAGMFQVFANDLADMRLVFDEVGPRGATGETFDAECSGASVQVEHPPTNRSVPFKNGKERFLHPIQHGAGAQTLRRLQAMPFCCTGNHTHCLCNHLDVILGFIAKRSRPVSLNFFCYSQNKDRNIDVCDPALL